MKYLDISTGTRANKICMGLKDIMKEVGASESGRTLQLLRLTEALAKRWKGRQIVMLVDEIADNATLSKLCEQCASESVRMILVLNPAAYGRPLTLPFDKRPLSLPPSFLYVTLTTPYRSTIAITSLAHFIAKCKGLVVPEGHFGLQGCKFCFFGS